MRETGQGKYQRVRGDPALSLTGDERNDDSDQYQFRKSMCILQVLVGSCLQVHSAP